ncbi:TetR family transcriptional regulator [Bacillus sp. AFS076308]|uniref:TetR/AcrR family transcriptional regulator n=1 Tax=unclassified Bacillus (in: firmicutes) TaxID=185979 RepID=UPI000BFA4D72|nr:MULTISPECIES: TetR/AcrR family transcriptional regulator [unclassified Bacillus (in: firmicutes)]PFN97502.1 TetR family transcriptional regulator [Bacillus sp. AFS076308]PGV46793.1 TetR family transcriptional regulator [Bacillus sp. AFS037270]
MARERKFSTEDLFQITKQMLLTHGYEGFSFSLLAEQLEISRGAIYKYYENKEELITDYMLYEMEHFLTELKDIESVNGFDAKFDFLIDLIFKNSTIPHMIELGRRIPINGNQKVKENHEKLEKQHLNMYHHLQGFISLGRQELKLKETLPDPLILGFIFQTIMIPNHFGIPHPQWVSSIKEMIRHGMLRNE